MDNSVQAHNRVFKKDALSVGLMFPLEAYSGDTPLMHNQVELAQRAEALGFSALWFRDVPLRDPSFGDVGQIYDPFVFMSLIAAKTAHIALVSGAIVLPLRHPFHVAKMSASINQLFDDRLILGVSSGDRPREFPAFGVDFESRGERFRESYLMIKQYFAESFPVHNTNHFGHSEGALDLIPKPDGGDMFMPIVGSAQQSLEWIATHGDAWVSYPREPVIQAGIIERWREANKAVGNRGVKPFAQSLYIDLLDNPEAGPKKIHLGFSSGRLYLKDYLHSLREVGVEHIVLNVKYSQRPAAEVIEELGEFVVSR